MRSVRNLHQLVIQPALRDLAACWKRYDNTPAGAGEPDTFVQRLSPYLP